MNASTAVRIIRRMDAAMFHPHGWCFQWEPPLIGLHVGSDAVTALAYFSLPVGLGHLLLRRRDLPFKVLFALCGAFIVLCGLTHVASILVIWQPLYWTEGVVKAATALVSIATAIVAVRALPQLLRIPNPLIDPLTEVPSRAALYETVKKLIASGRPSVVLYVDLDGFKDVNDRYGHAVGDQALIAVANACMEGKRSSDIVGRLGGEEFAMLLPETDLYQARIVAERVRKAVAASAVTAGGVHFNVTASVGLAAAAVSMSGFEALLGAADQALYRAKNEGRNRVVAWSPPPAAKLAAE